MLKKLLIASVSVSALAGTMTFGSIESTAAQATGIAQDPGASTQHGQLDPIFQRQRRLDFNISRLVSVTKRPLRLFENTHLQSMTVVGSTVVAAGLYVNTSNVAITTFNLAGRATGWMRLLNVGHATSIAAQNVNGRLVVWIEADTDRKGGEGRGRSLARVPFVSRSTVPTARLSKFKPARGSTHVNPAIDYATQTLAVRYRVNGRTYFDRYNLAQARKGRYIEEYATVAPLPCDDREAVIQGWAVSGDFMYCIQGVTGGATHVGWRNLKTEMARRYLIRYGANQRTREAEGMTVVPFRGRDRLIIGMVTRAGDRRFATLLTST